MVARRVEIGRALLIGRRMRVKRGSRNVPWVVVDVVVLLLGVVVVVVVVVVAAVGRRIHGRVVCVFFGFAF